MATVPDQLRIVAQKIRQGEAPEPVTVRSLLGWFNCERRGRFVVQWIRAGLAEAGLVTDPDFDSVWLDAYVSFRAASEQPPPLEGGVPLSEAQLEPAVETRQAPF